MKKPLVSGFFISPKRRGQPDLGGQPRGKQITAFSLQAFAQQQERLGLLRGQQHRQRVRQQRLGRRRVQLQQVQPLALVQPPLARGQVQALLLFCHKR